MNLWWKGGGYKFAGEIFFLVGEGVMSKFSASEGVSPIPPLVGKTLNNVVESFWLPKWS